MYLCPSWAGACLQNSGWKMLLILTYTLHSELLNRQSQNESHLSFLSLE